MGAVLVVAITLTGCDVFGDGTFPVGSPDSQSVAGVATPGTYETAGGPRCYWQRTTDLSVSFTSIIANHFGAGPDVVTILPTDGGFSSEGCGLWGPVQSGGPQVTSFGDGGYAIGINIPPGTYSAPGSFDCYWEQDRDFLNVFQSIISSDTINGAVTVTLAPSAVKFYVQGCGVWTKLR